MNVEPPTIVTLLHDPLAAASNSPASSRALRVLVVDDDIATRHLHCLLLSRAGYAVDAAADGE